MKYILIILAFTLPMLIFAQHSPSEIKMNNEIEAPQVEMSVQLYSLRSLIGTPELFAKNHEDVLHCVAEMGFSGVEAASYEDGLFSGLSPLSFRQAIEKAGLKIISSHATHPLSEEELKTGDYTASLAWWDKCIAAHNEAGIKTLVMSWSQPLNDIHQIRVMSRFLNAIGQHCQAAGIRFGYHSHSHEFKEVDGTTMMDEFISNTVPENVFFEMDVYWAVVAGVSPVEYMKKYPGRFKLLHIKDKYEIGQSGIVGFEPIFRNMHVAGTESFVVEMEYASTPDILKGLRESALYLRLAPYTKKRYAPVNSNATPEARALLQRLYKTVEEGKIISGLHHNQLQMPNYRRDLNRIEDASGKEPLIWGGDVAWDAAKVVEMASEQHSRGHIITLMWHAGRPFDRGIVNFKQQTQGSFTDQQWKELITEGSEMHQLWIAQVDSIAEYLKVLQERHIPIIWRPLHEMNGEWFWWGNRPGPEGYQKVWRMLYDRLTNYHHLDNLLWVWNANAVRDTPGDRAMKLDDYYPGSDCVDILATDVYHRDWRQCHHDDLAKLADGKLIALGELGDNSGEWEPPISLEWEPSIAVNREPAVAHQWEPPVALEREPAVALEREPPSR